MRTIQHKFPAGWLPSDVSVRFRYGRDRRIFEFAILMQYFAWGSKLWYFGRYHLLGLVVVMDLSVISDYLDGLDSHDRCVMTTKWWLMSVHAYCTKRWTAQSVYGGGGATPAAYARGRCAFRFSEIPPPRNIGLKRQKLHSAVWKLSSGYPSRTRKYENHEAS